MIEKDVSLEKIETGKYKGLFRLKIKAKYTTTFIITQENINKINNDIKEIKTNAPLMRKKKMTRRHKRLVRMSFRQYLAKNFEKITVPMCFGILFFLLEHPIGIFIILITVGMFIFFFYMNRDELK